MVTKSLDLTYYVWRLFGQVGGAWYGKCDQYPVCATAWTTVDGYVDVEAAFPISVPSLVADWHASAISVNRVEFMAFAYNTGITAAETYVDWYANGYTKKGGVKVDFPGTWDKISQLIALPIASDGAPLYDDFTVGFHLWIDTGIGATTLALGNPSLVFDVTTVLPTSPVTIQVFGPDAVTPWEGVSVVVTGPERAAGLTDYNGELKLDLFDGTYHLKATKKINDTTYTTELDFIVPQDLYVPVTMEEAPWLPWWWWIPIAAGGGLIGLWIITRMLKRPAPPTPPVYIVR